MVFRCPFKRVNQHRVKEKGVDHRIFPEKNEVPNNNDSQSEDGFP